MAQKRYSLVQGGSGEDVTTATDATSLGSDVIRLIVKDDINQREAIAAIEFLKRTYLQDDYPFS